MIAPATVALVLLVGAPDGRTQWTLSESLRSVDCEAMLETLPQDILLTTWGSEFAMDGFMFLMEHPDAPWSIRCVAQTST